MKKYIAVFITIMFMGLEVQAATLTTAIAKYKKQNYSGCMNDIEDASQSAFKEKSANFQTLSRIIAKADKDKIVSGDPKELSKLNDEMKEVLKPGQIDNAKWAYMFYYYALSLHQIGLGSKAREYYNAAFTLTPNSKIGEYSATAISCIDSPDSCASSDMDEFIQSGKQVSDDIIKKQLEENLEKHRNEINQGKDLSYIEDLNNKIAWVDAGIPDINEIGKVDTKEENIPTDEEIGKAVRTLQKAGINPMGYMNTPYNSEYAQLNSLLNTNNGNGYSNDYSTMMLMNSNGKISPELMQTIMRQQMMGGYGF